MSHDLVIGLTCIVKPSQVVEHLLDLRILAMQTLEEFLMWTIEACLFDFFNLIFISVYNGKRSKLDS